MEHIAQKYTPEELRVGETVEYFTNLLKNYFRVLLSENFH